MKKTFMGHEYDDSVSYFHWGLKDGPPDNLDIGAGRGKTVPIQPVRDIYRLEYVSNMLRGKIEEYERLGRNVSVRTKVTLNDMRSQLERLVDAEGSRLAFCMYLWAKAHTYTDPTFEDRKKRALELFGSIETITEQLCQSGKLPDGKHVPSHIFLGVTLPNGKQVTSSHIKHLDAAGFGNVWNWVSRMSPEKAKQKITEYVDANYREPQLEKTVKLFYDSVKAVEEAKTVSEKVIAFHRALNSVHYSGFIANNIYGQGTVEELTRLSNMNTAEWDREVSQLIR